MPKMPTDLPENDRALVKAARAGRVWRPMDELPTPEQLANPEFVNGMEGVQASTIRALYLGLWDDVVVDPMGVCVCGARIDGTLYLSFGAGRGALSLEHCHFKEQVVAQEARLPALWLDASHLANGLHGDGVRIEGDLSCRDGFHSQREVRLLGAQIGGDAAFGGARLSGAKDKHGVMGRALNADRIEVKGGIYCRENDGKAFRIVGAASLVGGRIVGQMDWRPNEWTGELNLSHAVVGRWCDAWGCSDEAVVGQSSVILDHFTYGAFLSGNGMKADSGTRIAWIQAAQGDNFTPGPYQTLARVLRAGGDDRGAAEVGLAKARARVKHHAKEYGWPRRWLYRVWMGMLDLSIGHGYRPWRGAIGLLILLMVGWGVFKLYAPTSYCGPGHIKPADPVFITENQTRGFKSKEAKPPTEDKTQDLCKTPPAGHAIQYELPPEYTPFSAFWYSFDTLIPLIDLGQEKAWSPSPLTPEITKDPAGWLLLFYLYLHIIAGWVLTTLTVVAMTGLIKRDKDEE